MRVFPILLLISLISHKSFASTWFGLDYGQNLSKSEGLKDQDLTHISGHLFKSIKYLDFGLSFGQYRYENEYKQGPFYSSKIDNNLFSLDINPNIMVSSQVGLSLKNSIFLNKELKTDLDSHHRGKSGLGAFYISEYESFNLRYDLSYQKAWDFSKNNDFIIASISFTFDGTKPKSSNPAPAKKAQVAVETKVSMTKVYFKFESAKVSNSDSQRLQELALILKKSTLHSITINGHADLLGPVDLNERLSAQRAKNVAQLLGLSLDDALIQGFGSHQALSTEISKPANQANRRVEIIIKYPSLPENAELESYLRNL